MIIHLKELADLLSLHFSSIPPIQSLPYKSALQMKEQKTGKWGGRGREKSLMHVSQYVKTTSSV